MDEKREKIKGMKRHVAWVVPFCSLNEQFMGTWLSTVIKKNVDFEINFERAQFGS